MSNDNAQQIAELQAALTLALPRTAHQLLLEKINELIGSSSDQPSGTPSDDTLQIDELQAALTLALPAVARYFLESKLNELHASGPQQAGVVPGIVNVSGGMLQGNAIGINNGFVQSIFVGVNQDRPEEDHRRLVSWLYHHFVPKIDPEAFELLTTALLQCTLIREVSLDRYTSFDGLLGEALRVENTPQVRDALLTALDTAFPQPIPFAQLVLLIPLVEAINVPEDELKKLYYSSAPLGHRWRYPESNETQPLTLILLQLAKAPQQSLDGRIPLLSFVSRLAQSEHLESAVRQQLDRWLDEVIAQQGFTRSAVGHSLADHRSDHDTRHAFLLVMLWPHVSDETLFSVQARFIPDDAEHDAYQRFQPLDFDEENHTLVEMPGVIERLLKRCAKLLYRKPAQLTLEIFLPSWLLCHGVDQWQNRVAGFGPDVPLGVAYHVVVRSLERIDPLYRDELRVAWFEKWNTFERLHEHDSGNCIVCISPLDDYTPQIIYARLRAEDKVAFARLFELPSDDATHQKILASVISAGIPIAILPRQSTDEPMRIPATLDMLLKSCTIARLSKSVWAHRREALEGRDAHHIGYHLTLLWDDPNRLPPEDRFVELV